jgi:lipoprotein-anchoring transpeptidase ErfK/SrfK
MNRLWSVQLLFFLLIIPLMCLSVTNLSAQELKEDESGPVVKPPSYAASLVSEEITDIISEDIPEETPVEEPVQKHIIISLADQMMWVFEGDTIVQRFPVSTGVSGHRTPTGNYSVRNKSPRAYSNRYECYMPHWMAITADGQYGMHALEGPSSLRHLGSVASHGCIRLSPENAAWLYDWVEIGTPVEIMADYDEPPEAKSFWYRVGKHACI